jgi:hypothetical protein
MAIALDVSTPAAVWNDSAGTTSLATAAFTAPLNSIVVVKASNADASQTIGTPTATGYTFTSRINVGTSGSNCRAAIFTGVGTGVSRAVTVTFASTSQERGIVVEVWTGASLAGTPATDSFIASGTGAPSDAITTTGTNSVVTWMSEDFNDADGTTRTYSPTATETAYHRSAGYAAYQAYQSAASAGSQTYGISTPSAQKATMASLELQDSGGAAPTPQLPIRHMSAIARSATR